MQDVAFHTVLLLGLAAFSLVPSAFFFRANWRAGGSRRYLAVAGAFLLATVAGGMSFTSAPELGAQFEAWLAFLLFWLLLCLLAAAAWLSRLIVVGLSILLRRPKVPSSDGVA